MPSGVSSGYFRVCVTSPTMHTFYVGGDIAADGRISYELPWMVTQAVASDWKAKVFYYNDGGVKLASDASDGTFTIRP